MQILLDAVKYQHEKGYQRNRTIINQIQNDEEALKEAAEMIRCIISECLERNLPIDDALTEQHFATINKKQPNYAKLLNRAEHNLAFKQARSGNTVNQLRKIQERYEQKD